MLNLIMDNIYSQIDDFKYENGIYIENHIDNKDKNRYTSDNVIYKAGNKFHFTYIFMDTLSNEFYFDYSHKKNEWNIISKNQLSDTTVIGFNMEVLPGIKPFDEINPDYDQTVIKYSYLTPVGELKTRYENTGLIENKKNVWLHPPRLFLFTILELNPFPFIQTPFMKGSSWKWNLDIGEYWGDERWRKWEGIIHNQCSYVITEENVVTNTEIGNMNCFKIESTCNNEIGETFLVSYFNVFVGFVQLEYLNIDGTKMIIKLQKIER